MESKEFYIRYRIYVQSAEKADKAYGRRVCKNLKNLHNNIKGDKAFWEREIEEEIKEKTFIPLDLNHVNPKYYTLIATISEYFNSYAIWEKTMIKGSIKSINTFTIVGFNQDMLLAYHYITKLINNLNDMRFNIRKEYRRVRINQRRRGDKITDKENASVKASNYLYKSLEDINIIAKELLENRATNPILDEKLSLLDKYIRGHKNLDFRAYHYKGKPKLSNAFSRKDNFQNRRIIRCSN